MWKMLVLKTYANRVPASSTQLPVHLGLASGRFGNSSDSFIGLDQQARGVWAQWMDMQLSDELKGGK